MEEERKEKLKKNWTKWWLYGCIGLSLILIIATFAYVNRDRENITAYTAKEVKNYLEEKGYTITAKKSSYTSYIYIRKGNVTIKRIEKTVTGTSYSWKNSKINGDWADIGKTSENDDTTKKLQYNEYTQWLKEINLSKEQIIDVLDYCYENMEFKDITILTNSNEITNDISTDIKEDNSRIDNNVDETTVNNTTSSNTTNNNTSSSSNTSGTTNNNTPSSSKPSGTTSNNTSSSSNTSGTTSSNTSSSSNTSGTTSNSTSNNSSASGTASSITVSQQNAVRKAKEYLSVMPFSYQGLIEQLEYEKFSNADATYGVDNCGANWNEQALKQAKQYLSVMPFSREGLIEQLEYDKFTNAQATYGVNNCGANWNEQAAKQAKQYLDIMSFSREGLIEQLQYEKFTYEQAVYGVEANGL